MNIDYKINITEPKIEYKDLDFIFGSELIQEVIRFQRVTEELQTARSYNAFVKHLNGEYQKVTISEKKQIGEHWGMMKILLIQTAEFSYRVATPEETLFF